MNDMTKVLSPFGPVMMALTDKQRLFVLSWVSNGQNATKAAIVAGYSHKTARQQGSRLLSNVDIQAAITEFTAPIVEKLAFTAEDRLDHLSGIMRTPAADVVKVEHQLRAIDIGNRMDGLYVTKVDISDECTFEGFKRRHDSVLAGSNARKAVIDVEHEVILPE